MKLINSLGSLLFHPKVLQSLPIINDSKMKMFLNNEKGANVPTISPFPLLDEEKYNVVKEVIIRSMTGNLDTLVAFEQGCTTPEHQRNFRKIFILVLFDEVGIYLISLNPAGYAHIYSPQ